MATKTYPGRYDEQDIAALEQLAEATGRSRNYHLNEALKSYLAEQRWQISHIQEGLADLNAGRMTPHEDVMAKGRRIIAGFAQAIRLSPPPHTDPAAGSCR